MKILKMMVAVITLISVMLLTGCTFNKHGRGKGPHKVKVIENKNMKKIMVK